MIHYIQKDKYYIQKGSDVMAEKAYKYRIYPNKKQKELIQKTFGCCRFVYNYYLNKRKEIYENNKTTFTYNMCSKDLTQLKKEFEWLKEPDKDSLQKCLKDLLNSLQKKSIDRKTLSYIV